MGVGGGSGGRGGGVDRNSLLFRRGPLLLCCLRASPRKFAEFVAFVLVCCRRRVSSEFIRCVLRFCGTCSSPHLLLISSFWLKPRCWTLDGHRSLVAVIGGLLSMPTWALDVALPLMVRATLYSSHRVSPVPPLRTGTPWPKSDLDATLKNPFLLRVPPDHIALSRLCR